MINNKHKIVFCDIDGTLVNDNHYMTEETEKVIKTLVDNGIYFVLTSGKPFSVIKEFSLKCGAMPYVIGLNGASIHDCNTNEVIYSKSIEKQIVLDIIDFVKEEEVYVFIGVSSGKTVTEEAKYGFSPKNRKDITIVKSLREYVEGSTSEQLLKITIFEPSKKKLAGIGEKIREKFDLNITPAYLHVVPERFKEEKDKELHNPYVIEIMDKKVSKAEAIKELTKYLDIKLSETVAIGDETKDYDMLAIADYKIAMANATQELKDIADMVTTSNNESGVAKAMHKLFFEGST